MNLLPKTHDEFSQKDYWESFFKKRGNRAFEWYGEYAELCEHLHKYIKVKDDVLVVGCGNSTLSSDLYDVGYNKITNIDISQIVIRQMQSLHEKQRPGLKYIYMDALNMDFRNENFSVVLDKGTLDALMTDEKAETVEQITKYFSEIERVLRIGGRYVCISLLQKHILEMVLTYFDSKQWMFRVIRCYQPENNDSENSLPVFIVICTKFKQLPQSILEINLTAEEKMQRVGTKEEIIALISSVQQAAFVCSGLKRGTIGDETEVSLDLYKQGDANPRYTVYVVDLPHNHNYSPYAAFIVPQGREVEWLFSTKAGRRKLAQISKFNRLAIITMHRGQKYESLEKVQNELNDTVCNLAQAGVTGKILFLSLGSDVGSRIIQHEGHSDISGDYMVEDVSGNENEKFRRLFYLKSQSVIQSEAKLKTIKTRKGHMKEIIDHTYLTCKHHLYMSIGSNVACAGKSKTSIAVIGLGGGGLCMFFRKFMPDLHITAVDIDSDMQKVAKEWFGLVEDSKLCVRIEDGLDFLKQNAQKGTKFDGILFDVDSKDPSIGMSCPPKEFLHSDVLDDVIKCLNKTGLLILNLVLRDETLRQPILNDLKNKFSTIVAYKLEEDLNEVLICSTEPASLTNKIKNACVKLNTFLKANKQEDDEIELESFMNCLKIEEDK